jgi:hypothetical protein
MGWRDHRSTLHAGAVGHLVDSPTTRQPGGNPQHNRCVRRLALPPGCRVVALREVEEMPHLANLA